MRAQTDEHEHFFFLIFCRNPLLFNFDAKGVKPYRGERPHVFLYPSSPRQRRRDGGVYNSCTPSFHTLDARMGCAGSTPALDFAGILKSQPEGGALPPVILEAAACREGFVELTLKARPARDGALKCVWEGMYPPPEKPKAKNIEKDGLTVGTYLLDTFSFKTRPFIASFFDKHGKVQAVLTGVEDKYATGRGRAVLYARAPIPGATGHAPKTTADGAVLHPIAQIRPVSGGDYFVRFGGSTSESRYGPPQSEKGIGLYLAGPDGTFYEAPRDAAGAYLHELPVPKGQERPKPGPPPALFLAEQGSGADHQKLVRTANGETVALTDLGGFMPSGFTGVGHVIGVASNVDIVHVLALQIVEQLQGSEPTVVPFGLVH